MDTRIPRRFERYVAIGDSSTEGLDDPDGRGGYRGWSRRLARRIAEVQGSIEYANFGIRGRTTAEILREQLPPALALRPDLATVFSGTNDLARGRFGADEVARDMEAMQRALIAGGATVLTFTLPDLTPVMPIARIIAPRIRALNEALRGAAARSRAILVDFAAYPLGSDPRIWSADRIHANAVGHERIAEALAHALGLPGASDSWSRPLPPAPPKTRGERLAAELEWTRRHLLPWIGRGLHAPAPESSREHSRVNLEQVVPERETEQR
jgi:lysophospholipase L1-like esterase